MAKTNYPEFEPMETLPYTPASHPDRVGPGATMTKQAFCRTFGIARYDLDRAIENGGPVLKRGTSRTVADSRRRHVALDDSRQDEEGRRP
ncbi:hypothetical protein ACNJYA_09770 [Bradyrhizobium sp. DASA03068]|uniref:hypothetical protein n=1 Tax=Bradyrhizobium sp. BLXBL-01 TaxID=3395915 RepID=UPI003F710FC6